MIRRGALVLAMGLAPAALADQGGARTIALSAVEHTLWHQAAHMLISEFSLPVSGPHEDAADTFATLMMMSAEDGARLERVLDVAEMWMAGDRRDPVPVFLEAHDLDAERALRVICFLAGEGPGRAHGLIDRWGLPRDRAETCEDDYILGLEGWDQWLDPHQGSGAPISVTLAPSRDHWRGTLGQSELVELVAETLSYEYAIPEGVHIEARECPEADAGWDPRARVVTLCYGLLRDFDDLARQALSTRE